MHTLILSSRPKLTHDQWRQRVFDKTSRTTRIVRQSNVSVSLNVDASELGLYEERALVGLHVDVQVNFISSIKSLPRSKADAWVFTSVCHRITEENYWFSDDTVGRVYPDLLRSLTQWLHVSNVDSTECAGKCRTLRQICIICIEVLPSIVIALQPTFLRDTSPNVRERSALW